MNTAILSAEVNKTDIPLLEQILKKFKAKSIKIEIEQDNDTKMTKEEFSNMLKKSSESKKYNMHFKAQIGLRNL